MKTNIAVSYRRQQNRQWWEEGSLKPMMTESDLDRIIKTWATSYNEEVLQYAQPAAVNDSEVNFIMVCCCPKKKFK